MKHKEVHNQTTPFDCSNEINRHRCKICPNFQTSLLASLKCHIRNGHKSINLYKCLKCSLMTFSKYLMGRHSLFGECATRDENERKRRFVCIQSREKENVQRFCCELCPLKFQEKSYLEWHMTTKHASLYSSETYDSNPLQCESCSLEFKRKSELKIHIILHHTKLEDIQWFICSQCGSKFKLKKYLKHHLTSSHSTPTDVEWITCDLCPHKSKSKANLKKHIATCHSDSKPETINRFQCEQCRFSFSRKSYLNRHQKYHAKSKNTDWFQCEQCPCRFKGKSSLTRHQKRHSKGRFTQRKLNFHSD